MRRVLLLAAALTIPLSAVSVVALNGTAGAATTITCSAVSGSVSGGTITLSSCTDSATGGASVALPFATLESGGPVTWVSSTVTTFGAPTVKAPSAKKCPGYVKGNGTAAASFKGAVTNDSGDGIKIPGKESGEICISAAGNFSDLKPIKIS